MIPSWAVKGTKVVCINSVEWCVQTLVYTDETFPKHREVCQVSETEIWRGRAYIKVDGRVNWYQASFFRPLVTRSQSEDVAAIKKLVEDMPITERLDRLAELLE